MPIKKRNFLTWVIFLYILFSFFQSNSWGKEDRLSLEAIKIYIHMNTWILRIIPKGLMLN